MMKKYIFGLLTLFYVNAIPAQTLSQAKVLFEKGEFEKAQTAFSTLIKRSPSSAEINYYMGASLYETGESEKALPYLKKSAQRNYIGAFRYLGKVYVKMYQFDEALKNHETYIHWLEEKKRDTEMAESELLQLRNKARMFKNVEKVMVIDSIVIDKQQFLDAYKISSTAGKILNNGNDNGICHENEMGNKRIVSEMKDNKMQLYTQTKLIDEWSEKEPITALNGNGNVNYPFLLGDGTTLYYASDEEGTLGGYDIFVTRYDSEENTYLRPSNIGMPFNSPANDYMYVIDEFYNLGWFATDRNQPDGKVCIYVFIPNESKQTYNYEATDLKTIMDAATLREIRTTWSDEEKVRNAHRHLTTIKCTEKDDSIKKDFHFIINDNATYTTFADFQSIEARTSFQLLLQKEKDLNTLRQALQQKRNEFESENGLGKKKLEPSILSLEKRIPQLMEEVNKLTLEVRRQESEKLRK